MKIFNNIEGKILKFFPGNSKLYLWKNNSSQYWEDRYQNGGNSGYGSYGLLSDYKADFVNNFLIENKIETVIELGCGDGNQLNLINYPKYIGIDVSFKSIELCKNKFFNDFSKSFYHLSEIPDVTCDLSISMDVIFHLIEEEIFEDHMKKLFSHSSKFVLIYSSNENKRQFFFQPHIKHRKFSEWIFYNYKNWELLSVTKNPFKYTSKGSFSDFFIYRKMEV